MPRGRLCWLQCTVVFRCFQQLSVKHSHNCKQGSGRPRSTNARQDRCTVRAVVAARTASREEIQAHVEPAVSPRTIGNRLLTAKHVPLTRLPLTPQHCQTWLLWCHERVKCRVKWYSFIFNDETRFCLYARDGHTSVHCRPGECHLQECIHP